MSPKENQFFRMVYHGTKSGLHGGTTLYLPWFVTLPMVDTMVVCWVISGSWLADIDNGGEQFLKFPLHASRIKKAWISCSRMLDLLQLFGDKEESISEEKVIVGSSG